MGVNGGRHEELYVVLTGRARFTIDGADHDAAAGTLVFIPDPESRRSAVALEDGTSALAIGGRVGRAVRGLAVGDVVRRQGLAATGDADGAADLMAREAAARPDKAGLLYNAACFEALAGRREAALEHLRAALELEPEHGARLGGERQRPRLAARRPGLPARRLTADGQAQVGRPRARARGERPLLDRVRERRLVDLLRARPGRLVRARADPDRLHHHGVLLLLHGRHLRRGDDDVPGGGRLLELRAARLQRVLVVRGGVGADAHLHRHDRHLGVLRAALHRRPVLGAAALLAGRHHRRLRGDRRAGGDQRVRRQGVDRRQHPARGRRLRHPAAAGGRRRSSSSSRRRCWSTTCTSAWRRVEGLRPRDPDRHARLHGHRDDLEHVRGGARRGEDDPDRHQPRPHRRLRHLLHAARPSRCRRCRSPSTSRPASTRRCWA